MKNYRCERFSCLLFACAVCPSTLRKHQVTFCGIWSRFELVVFAACLRPPVQLDLEFLGKKSSHKNVLVLDGEQFLFGVHESRTQSRLPSTGRCAKPLFPTPPRGLSRTFSTRCLCPPIRHDVATMASSSCVAFSYDDLGLPVVAASSPAGLPVPSLSASGRGPTAVSTGTTIVAVSFKGGVVLGADTRTSAGSYVVNRAARKISRVHERICVCRSGSAADTQAVTQIVKLYIQQYAQELPKGEEPRVEAAANVFQSLCYQHKDALTAGLIVAGFDKVKGGQIYALPLGGALVPMQYTAGGSGSAFISAYMDANFKQNMTQEEAVNLVKNSVAYAISRDGSSGGMVRVVVITEDAMLEECVEGNKLPVAP
ncbi:proteasome subunit [Toxoplasma gondii ME49]|uniref:proteasome endopeptidase complex n=8 Tax=Toxoplasma gondii TaxID=5811 RepID=A0A2G8Y925_TOXGO|nr:proteasome subunit [Toxoplasma gondii ME49]KFG45824.1 proteasome subunit [Toxoplasma gondii GAB2-2007-GAL-DOM2]KFG53842.1 proteasome subunit [Toxoplasma gondii FOU]KFH01082.1 proteasome subunit [Toxoplasma gondii MAS]KYF42235.1 proteasome subunit [Toxoplasma gondii ARI]PIM03766.1 proteasome subunit [Toxoplasma gondii COUG]PUA91442.1 proteasome subunit [Toxoplasma gondii TgCATBr9]RQX68302.1 proteasome subunit [Toxoplasma gondii CAST]|eukprot:XP_018635900.1 proteasome subunit [Toxoplasma gondii ME49]